MSNFGQAALTVVGTVVGAYFGYPQLGFVIGSYVGQAAFPTQLPTIRAPRLSDIGQTKATVGSPIPKGWGCFPSDGAIIAATDVREEITSQSVGGKGGPTQKVEQSNYFQSFAIGLNDGEIAGVRRIWANAKLIYDRTPQRDDESPEQFQARMAANAALEETMVVYLGDEDQLPDPTLEAYFGIGNVSAFRGLAYIVFSDWFCKEEDGKRMPSQWRFECFTEASIDSDTVYEYANEQFGPWLPGVGVDVRNPINAHTYFIAASGIADDDVKSTPISSITQGLAILETYRSKPFGELVGVAASTAGLGGLEQSVTDTMGGTAAVDSSRDTIWYHYNTFPNTLQPYDLAYSPWAPPGVSHCERMATHAGLGETFVSTDGYTLIGTFTDTGNKQYMLVAPGSGTPDYWDFNSNECGVYNRLESIGVAIGITRAPRGPDDPCTPIGGVAPPRVPGTDDFAFVGGRIVRCGGWTRVDTGGPYHVLRRYLAGPPTVYPLNPARPVGHPEDTEEFWTLCYEAAKVGGKMPEGLVYGVDYPQSQSYVYRRQLVTETVDVAPVSIQPIAEYVHEACGYSPQEYDVTDLEPIEVIGFIVPAPNVGRGIMEALRAIGFFDLTDGAGIMRWVRRGKAITRTLGRGEMRAHLVGEDPPSEITTRRELISGIPRQLRFHYISYERDFDPGEKKSPVRSGVRTAQALDVETTVVLEDGHAAQIMQTLWADLWASRWRHETALDTRALADEPTDVLGVPVDDLVQRMRIESIDDVMPLVRKYSMVRDDDGSYVSYAVGTGLPVSPPPLTVRAPAQGVLLDIPMLRDADNDAGFYWAARSYYMGSPFRGATLVRSTEGGGNYSAVSAAATAAASGIVTSAIAAADPGVWDEGSTFLVELLAGELENKTAAEVMAGENAAAVGAPGRWELIGFKNAEPLIDNVWKISGLLRGRRGTEHAIGQSAIGDGFVLLSDGGINRVPMDLILVGRELFYKTIAAGQNLDSAEAQLVTTYGVGLKPFSPAGVRGAKDLATGNWLFEFSRRGRIGNSIVDGASIPLSEEDEDYEIDIFDEAGEVRDTISTSVQSATWSAADQIAAFGEELDTVTIEVFQISASVGRGYGTRVTLTA